MNQVNAIAMMNSIVVNHYFNVADALHDKLGVPKTILGLPDGEISGVVDAIRKLTFRFWGRRVESKVGDGSMIWDAQDMSATYQPKARRILVSTDTLSRDSIDSNVSEEALLEILVFHELVHLAMMGDFVYRVEPAAIAWFDSTDQRYIHEMAALKACEFIFSDFYQVATTVDVKNYIDFVQVRSENGPDGRFYNPYFEMYRQVPVNEFWNVLSERAEFDWDALLNQVV